LPGRINIVLTRSTDLHTEGVLTANTLEQALEMAAGEDEAMVIGGSAIYALALPRADRLYLTYVENSYEGDAWFPPFDSEQWRVIASEEHAADGKNPCGYRFVTYERK
jgi:dihydrofolate reductase